MEYRCISADCHIDLNWLPHDLFTSNASAAMKERMPYVVKCPEGLMWTNKQGVNLAFANGVGSAGAMGGNGRLYVSGREHRFDRMASTGLYSDGSKGIFRPTTPALRIQDQDRDGLQAEVMYGLITVGNKLTDREASIEFYRIYNEWLADFCNFDRKRFVGLASLPSHSVEAAVAEAHRAAKLRLGGLDFSPFWGMIPLWNPYWDPLWHAADELNLAVHFHTIGTPPPEPPPPDLAETYKQAGRATFMAGFQLYTATVLASVIQGGALERFPNLRIVLGESGIGWIPYVLDRMDYEFDDRYKGVIPIKLKPSEYWHRQCRATFQNDVIGLKLLEDLGVENVMWGSDYPHTDGVFPDSQEYIAKQFNHMSSDVKRKIICENAGKFYGLMQA
jgi:predicted TIM-barrel fold metal-dependent hydrolase